MDKRYQVFISSTFADLEEERKVVMEAILECDCFPAGMEMFPALDMDQFEYIKAIIDKCDYYVLVVAGRYGSLAPDKIGYTEKEYRYAIEKEIPVLVFVKRDIDNIPAKYTDQDKNLKKRLLKFRQEIGVGRLISMWDDKNELKSKICLSLKEAFKSNPRIGWIRASEMIKTKEEDFSELYEKLHKEIPLNIKGSNSTCTIYVKLFDFIMLIGDSDSTPNSKFILDNYESKVGIYIDNILKSCTSELIYDVFYKNRIKYSLIDITKKLCALKLINVTSSYEVYSVSLTEFGTKIYEKTILDSI